MYYYKSKNLQKRHEKKLEGLWKNTCNWKQINNVILKPKKIWGSWKNEEISKVFYHLWKFHQNEMKNNLIQHVAQSHEGKNLYRWQQFIKKRNII